MRSISAFERAGAALQEDVHRQWRDWTGYLEGHLTLLDARAAERQVAFERDADLEAQVRQAHIALAALPPARRTLFDQLREERRQATQAAGEVGAGREGDSRLLDPDAVERQALQALLREALGEHDQAGWGVVPIREGASVTWYEVNVAALRAAPSAAAYAIGTDERSAMRTRSVLAVLLVVVGVLFLLVWFLWPRGAIGGSATPAPATANGVALRPWPIVAVLVRREGQDALMLTVQAGPSPRLVEGSPNPAAIWYPEHLVPLRLCLPADVLAEARGVTLMSGEGQPDRVYALAPEGGPVADLQLEPCSGSAPSRPAMLQQIVAPSDATLGDERTLHDGVTATLSRMNIVGPGDDPALPPGQARVTLAVQAPITDWAFFAPTLRLAGGQALLPAEAPTTRDGAATLTYLIPLPARAAPVVWSLTPPGSQRPIRWRANLPAPPERAVVVADALVVTDLAAAQRDGTLTLTMTVRNERELPFALTPADIQLTHTSSAEPLALVSPEPAVLTAPLAPGATRTLTFTAGLRESLREPLILTVGVARFRIAPGG